MVDITGRGVRGVGAGVVATGVEALLTGTESRLRGRRAVYDPSNLARRLASRYLRIRLSHRSARRAGHLMRWSYGPSWGALLAAGMGTRKASWVWPLWGLGLGAAVLGFEVIMLPATGATPPVSSWSRDELKLEVLNTTAFGLAAAAFMQTVSPARTSSEKPSRRRPGSRARG